MAVKRIVVTGASGFIGRAVVDNILDGACGSDFDLCLVDLNPSGTPAGTERIAGSFADEDVQSAMLEGGIDILFHLASIPGGAAERDFARGRSVNLDATLMLLDKLSSSGNPPLIVCASSTAALGAAGLSGPDSPLRPNGSYGTHKAMVELYIADLTRRGLIDGRSVRPAAIVARPRGSYEGFATAWMSDLFHAVVRGEDLSLPVVPDALFWFESVRAAAADIVHAATIPPGALGRRRAWTLPAVVTRIDHLVDTLRSITGSSSRVTYGSSPFRQGALDAGDALSLGFRGDGNVEVLIANVLERLDG